MQQQGITRLHFFAVYVLLLVYPMGIYADTTRGYIGVQTRYFWNKPAFISQEEHSLSLAGFAEYTRQVAPGQQLTISGFGRLDSADDDRSHLDMREAYWLSSFNDVAVTAGVQRIFWGVAESVHLVDVINQDDLAEDIDGEDKLGQPMLQASWTKDWGSLQAFLLPYFREKAFPSKSNLNKGSIPVLDDAVYQSGAGRQHLDWALRWATYYDIWDIGVTHFSGTSRDPLLIPVMHSEELGLLPYYQQINQTGIDLQATVDAWLLKLEAISVDERDHGRNTALVGGLEYTFFSLMGGNADLGVVAEYQFDDRIGLRETMNQNDLALGVRLALNDFRATEMLAIIAQDLEHSNRFISVEANRRLSSQWRITAEARVFSAIEPGTPEFSLREDDYIQLELRRYF